MSVLLRLSGLALVSALAATTAAAQDRPQRIVSLAPSATEVLFEAGAGSRVVGVTTYCRYPPAVLALSKVGGYMTPSYEALVRLRPDLVVTLEEHRDLEPRIAALGIPILRLDHRSLDGIARSVERAGERCGTEAVARRAAASLRQTLGVVGQRGTRPPPRVLICIGRAMDSRTLTAAAPGTIYDDLIARAGGVNVLTSSAVAYPTLSAEGVLRLNPDVIIEIASSGDDAAVRRQQWNRFDSTTAVKSGRVHVLTEDFLTVPGPRFVRFTATVARLLRSGR